MSFQVHEYASFKLLLKQVYSAHTSKVKELENEVKNLKEQLSLKVRESENILECKRCGELEAAFKSCKKALQEQSKFFETFGQKFSIFNGSDQESQELKAPAKLCATGASKLSKTQNIDVINADKNEITVLPLKERISIQNITDNTLKECAIVGNQNLLNKVMCDEGSTFDMCTVTFPQNHISGKCDVTIYAPDTLDVDLDNKKGVKRRSTDCLSEDDTHKKASNTESVNHDKKDKGTGMKLFSDSLNEDRLKKLHKNDKSDDFTNVTKSVNIKIEDINQTKSGHLNITANCGADRKGVKDSEAKNVQIVQKGKNVVDVVISNENKTSITPRINVSPSVISDIKKIGVPYETSPSLLLTNTNALPKGIDLNAMVNDNEDFIENGFSCSKSNQSDDSGDTCDKRKIMRKRQPAKSVKSTSKYKMSLDAPPLNYKKPSFKQSKLSKSFFQGKQNKVGSKTKLTRKLNEASTKPVNKPIPTIILDEFQTSTPCDAVISPNPIDIDATFIPENYRNELTPLATTNVKRNGVEISNLRNGNLFSNISFPENLKSSLLLENSDIEEIPNSPSLEDEDFKENLNSFDKIPVAEEPNYKYKNDVVRKKSERKQLNGFDCKECEKYYSDLGLSDKEKKERMKKCSRHRAKFALPDTPDHFWELDFPDTQECKARGYMNETQKVKLNQLCDI